MKKEILLALIFLVFANLQVLAQNTGSVRGVVTDSTNGEILAFGNAFIEELNTGASTDVNGYFFITSLPAGKTYTLIVSYVGYESKSLDVFVAANKITEVDVKLAPSGIELQTVEKIGEKVVEKNATDIGLQRISIKQLEMMPKGVETDVFRSLQYMPGVRSTGDISAKYYVRGGASNQNLVLLNDVPVYNPFHALGMFSVIDPEMINNMEFYKGGFTSEYGGRLSSVLNLITKDGNKNRFGGSASISQLTAKAAVQGPIPNGSFILTGRQSYSTKILKKFLNNKTAPFEFYDYSFKLNYADPGFIEGSKFVIHGFASNDKLDEEDPFKEDFSWSNKIFGFKWFQVYDSPLFSELSISLSQFNGEVIPNYSDARPQSNELSDVNLKMDFTYIFPSKNEVAVGIDIKSISTKLHYVNERGLQTNVDKKGANISLYGKYKLLQWEDFGLDAGTRLNLTGLSVNGGFFFEPRVSATYRFNPLITLKAAWGIYQQELTTLADENEVISLFEPWVIIPDYLNPSRAIHYTVGLDLQLTEYMSLELETYYKIIHDFPAINEGKQFSTDPDLVTGTGESYGFEGMYKLNLDPVRFTASYSLAYAYKEINGWLYYPRYDARHTLNLSLEYNMGAGWSANTVWVFSTGLPFTPSIGFYDKLYFDNLHEDWFIYNNYNPYSLLGDKNIARYPNYHRLDISVSKKMEIGPFKISISGSIINIYNRENLFYYDRGTGKRVNMLPFLPTATLKVEI